MFRVLVVLAVLVSLGCVGCACGGAVPGAAAGRVAKPSTASLQASNLPADAAEAVFAAAIRGRRPIAFDYSGVSRVAHPHRMGASVAGNGKTLVRCWEVSRGGEATGTWKLFEVGKASGAALLPGSFSPAAGYTPADRAIPAPTAEIEITKDTKGTKGTKNTKAF